MPGQLKYQTVYPPQGSGARLHVKAGHDLGGGATVQHPTHVSSMPNAARHGTNMKGAKPRAHGFPVAMNTAGKNATVGNVKRYKMG